MNCESWLPTLLAAAEDGLDRLDGPERDRFTAHLEHCAACQDALDEQRAVHTVLATRSDADVPPGFTAHVAAGVTIERSWGDLIQWRTWSIRLAPLAAGLLLFSVVMARSVTEPTQVADLPDLAETWAFGASGTGTRPAFTVLGQDGITGDVLLDAILSTEPHEPLTMSIGDDGP